MEGTLAEIRMFAGNFAPRAWMLCQGQLLSIAQWTAVFALLGTTYGGNGQTTFGLPDFRGRLALGTGQGPGQPNVDLGEMAGVPTTTLILTNLPMHNHALTGSVTQQANNDSAGLTDDASQARTGLPSNLNIYTKAVDTLVPMAADVSTLQVGFAGGNQAFNNRSPYLGIEFIICVEGIFPSRD